MKYRDWKVVAKKVANWSKEEFAQALLDSLMSKNDIRTQTLIDLYVLKYKCNNIDIL